MDWRFQGAISEFIREGALTGKPGECAYIPFTRNGTTYHLILAGAGHSQSPGVRAVVPAETWRAVQKNLSLLKLERIGISRTDFGNVSEEFLSKNIKGVPLWIVP